ncbi:SLATT domain-containing protein [Gordonia terrae]
MKILISSIRRKRRRRDLRFELPRATDNEPKNFRTIAAHIVDAREWYLRNKRGKKLLSKLIRTLTIFASAIGALIPIASVSLDLDLAWGYAAFIVAGSAFTFDRYFGVSATWIRDTAASRRLDSLLVRYWLYVNNHLVAEKNGLPDESAIEKWAIEEFDAIITNEFEQWQTDLSSTLDELRTTAEDRKTGRNSTSDP